MLTTAWLLIVKHNAHKSLEHIKLTHKSAVIIESHDISIKSQIACSSKFHWFWLHYRLIGYRRYSYFYTGPISDFLKPREESMVMGVLDGERHNYNSETEVGVVVHIK